MEEERVATKLSRQDIANAKAVIASYITTCQGYNANLETLITNLTADNADFNGDAAAGYMNFYNKIKPAFTTQLIEAEGIMKSLDKILDSIESALMGTMDPNLKNANENAGTEVAAEKIDLGPVEINPNIDIMMR